MNNKGMSLVEIMAVIVIMGIVASIGVVSAVAVIDRQRKNSVVNALNNIYGTAKDMLLQTKYTTYEDYIVIIDDGFCYLTLTDMVEHGAVDRVDYEPAGNEIFFCYDMDESWWVEVCNDVSSSKPTSTGETIVQGVSVTFDYTSGKFKKA